MQRVVNAVSPGEKPDYVQLAQEMGKRRLARRDAVPEDLDRYMGTLPGRRILGRESNGNSCWTKEPHVLKMAYPENGLVSIRFGMKFSKRGSSRIEGKKARIETTDIYNAVRKARHVWEGYVGDIAKRDRLLRKTEMIHAHIKCRGKGYSDADFEKRVASLGRIFRSVKRYTSDLNEEGKARFAEARETLVAAEKTENRSVRMRLLYNACAKLVAFGNDFGVWRDEQAIYTKMFNQLRERTLRAERDARLLKLLCRWEKMLGGNLGHAAMNVWKKDAQFAKTMVELSEKLKWGDGKRERWLTLGMEKIARTRPEGCAHLLKPLPAKGGQKHWIDAEMEAMGLAEQVAILRNGQGKSVWLKGEEYWVRAAVLIIAKRLAEQGYDEEIKGKYSIVRSNLRDAYLILKSADDAGWCEALKSASKEVELGAKMLLVNNPLYAAEQLAEEPEAYLTAEKKKNASILKYVQEGAKLIERRNLERAAYCFGEAQKFL